MIVVRHVGGRVSEEFRDHLGRLRVRGTTTLQRDGTGPNNSIIWQWMHFKSGEGLSFGWSDLSLSRSEIDTIVQIGLVPVGLTDTSVACWDLRRNGPMISTISRWTVWRAKSGNVEYWLGMRWGRLCWVTRGISCLFDKVGVGDWWRVAAPQWSPVVPVTSSRNYVIITV